MSQIEKLHQIYCDETRLFVSCTLFRHFTWEAFINRGFTDDDLRLVCKQARKQVNTGRWTMGAISFHRLVGDLEYFEELLAQFRALQRKPFFSKGKTEVLKATQRPAEPQQPPAKPAGDVLKGLKIAQQLRDFKDSL